MEKLYRLLPWVEDPFTNEGFNRYRESISDFTKVVEHKWFKELLDNKRKIKIVELCSGTGIGGIALAKVLLNLGIDVDLTLVDIRYSALAKAVDFGLKELGLKPEILVRDVLRIEELNLEKVFDIALIWGSSTPHFNPWSWISVLANISKLLVDNGLFIYDEVDRVQTVFYLTGYKDFLPELVERDRIVLSIHVGKDIKTGYFKRLYIDLLSKEREELEIYFWDIASSAAFTWLFFSDIDCIELKKPHKVIILGKNPRRIVNLENLYREKPQLFKT